MRLLILIAAAALFPAGAGLADEATEITGFVDAAYFQDFAQQRGTFNLDQAEIDVIHRASPDVLLRADLEWIRIDDEHVAQIEQGFLTWGRDRIGAATLGKWNAPIGFEALDPVDMYQYSHSLVWEYGAPSNLTGLRLQRAFNPVLDLQLYGVNGWDLEENTNRRITWGGRLGVTTGDLNVGVSAISGRELGSEPADVEFDRTVFDVDLTFTPEYWVIGGELNMGSYQEIGAREQTWTGYLLMANYQYVDWGSFTVRWDLFDDRDGHAFGVDGGLERSSGTFAALFTLAPGAGVLVEVRRDLSTEDYFERKDGTEARDMTTAAVEATFSF